jgi:hypothetical protein
MADILKFPSRPTAGKVLRNQGPARVIIFPGTRIERREFNLSDRTKPLKGISKQGRSTALELDDR